MSGVGISTHRALRSQAFFCWFPIPKARVIRVEPFSVFPGAATHQPAVGNRADGCNFRPPATLKIGEFSPILDNSQNENEARGGQMASRAYNRELG